MKFFSLLTISFSLIASDANNLLNLYRIRDQFTDVLENWREIPSRLYRRDQVREFLSSEAAKELRKDLGAFRDEMTTKFLAEVKKRKPDFFSLSKEITQKYLKWIDKYLKKTLPIGVTVNDFALIGFGSMAREEVAGLYTDLEAAILIENSDPASLFLARSLAENISTWFNMAGEHPNMPMQQKGFRPDEEANFPFNFSLFAKGMTDAEAYCLAYRSLPRLSEQFLSDEEFEILKGENESKKRLYPFEGSWAFITTPENLASYFKGANYDMPFFPFPKLPERKDKQESWYRFAMKFITNKMFDKNYIERELRWSSCADQIMRESTIGQIAQEIRERMIMKEMPVINYFDSIGRNTVHIFGKKELFDQYQEQAKKILDGPDKLRERGMVKILHGLLLKFRKEKNGGEIFLNGNLPEITDVKRILYRFDEQIWTTLARLYDLSHQNVRDIINEFVARKFITRKFANKHIDLLNSALGLRWKESILAQGQLSTQMNYLDKEKHTEAIAKKEGSINILEEKIKFMKRNNVAFSKIASVYEKLTSEKNKLRILQALDPMANDPAISKAEIEKWRKVYAPALEDLYRRVLYFVGGPERIENKEYAIANPDAFKEELEKVPEVDKEHLMAIP